MARSTEHPLFAQAPTGVLLLTREGLVTDLNGEARRILAVAPEALIGRPVLATVAPDDRSRVKGLFLRVLQGQTMEWTGRFRRGDGSTRVEWVRATPYAIPGEDPGVLMFIRDATESRSGRPETYQLQTLLENMPGQFVVVLDNDRRVRYSSGLSRTHYRDDVSVVGGEFTELLATHDDNVRLLDALMSAVAAGESWAGTFWHLRVDGVAFPVRTFATPHREPRAGGVLGALVVGRDVSAEHDARARARRAQRLAGVGGLSAEIAGALRAGMGDLSTGLDGLAGSVAPERLEALVAQVERMQRYVASIDRFGRDLSTAHDRVCAAEAAREALEARSEDLGALGAEAELVAVGDIGVVSADAESLLGVLDEVVSNAVDALAGTPDPKIRISFDPGPDSVGIRVRDNGAGVAPEHRARLFEPFFTTRPGRAGLGLARAQAQLQLWGGRIRLDDQDEPGTTILLELPREAPDSTEHFNPAPLQLSDRRSVLIADDEAQVRASIRRFLEKVGFEVREAWSGRSALAQITVGSPPELVLTDLRMDDGSGYWFLDELARDFPDLLRHTVIITGETHGGDVTRVAERTGCPVLTKPLELPRLLEVLDDVVRRG